MKRLLQQIQNISHLYPNLWDTVVEYQNINAYVSRVLSVDSISENLTGSSKPVLEIIA